MMSSASDICQNWVSWPTLAADLFAEFCLVVFVTRFLDIECSRAVCRPGVLEHRAPDQPLARMNSGLGAEIVPESDRLEMVRRCLTGCGYGRRFCRGRLAEIGFVSGTSHRETLFWYPEQPRTGSAGYFANLGSINDSLHR